MTLTDETRRNLRKWLRKLENEIDDIQRRIDNDELKSDDFDIEDRPPPSTLPVDVSDIQSLAITAANLLDSVDVEKIHPDVNSVIGGILGKLSTFFEYCSTIQSDTDIDAHDKKKIIEEYRQETRTELQGIARQINYLQIEESDDSQMLIDKAQNILLEALRILRA